MICARSKDDEMEPVDLGIKNPDSPLYSKSIYTGYSDDKHSPRRTTRQRNHSERSDLHENNQQVPPRQRLSSEQSMNLSIGYEPESPSLNYASNPKPKRERLPSEPSLKLNLAYEPESPTVKNLNNEPKRQRLPSEQSMNFNLAYESESPNSSYSRSKADKRDYFSDDDSVFHDDPDNLFQEVDKNQNVPREEQVKPVTQKPNEFYPNGHQVPKQIVPPLKRRSPTQLKHFDSVRSSPIDHSKTSPKERTFEKEQIDAIKLHMRNYNKNHAEPKTKKRSSSTSSRPRHPSEVSSIQVPEANLEYVNPLYQGYNPESNEKLFLDQPGLTLHQPYQKNYTDPMLSQVQKTEGLSSRPRTQSPKEMPLLTPLLDTEPGKLDKKPVEPEAIQLKDIPVNVPAGRFQKPHYQPAEKPRLTPPPPNPKTYTRPEKPRLHSNPSTSRRTSIEREFSPVPKPILHKPLEKSKFQPTAQANPSLSRRTSIEKEISPAPKTMDDINQLLTPDQTSKINGKPNQKPITAIQAQPHKTKPQTSGVPTDIQQEIKQLHDAIEEQKKQLAKPPIQETTPHRSQESNAPVPAPRTRLNSNKSNPDSKAPSPVPRSARATPEIEQKKSKPKPKRKKAKSGQKDRELLLIEEEYDEFGGSLV